MSYPSWEERQALSGVTYGPTYEELEHKRIYEERCQRIREYYRQQEELERQNQAIQARIDEEGDQGSGAGCAVMGGRRRRTRRNKRRKSKSRRR